MLKNNFGMIFAIYTLIKIIYYETFFNMDY